MTVDKLMKEKEFFAQQVLDLQYGLPLETDGEVIEKLRNKEGAGESFTFQEYISELKEKVSSKKRQKKFQAFLWSARAAIGFLSISYFFLCPPNSI